MRKNIKLKDGVSLIVLIITIVSTLILLTTITISADNIINNNTKKKFAKEIYEVQSIVDKYKYENDEYPYVIEDGEKKIITININNVLQQFSDEDVINNTVTLYKINLSKAGIQNLSIGTEKNDNINDVYAFSQKTGKVYYVKGYKVSNITYYTLTDELKSLIGLKTEDSKNSNIKILSKINNDGGYIKDGLILYYDGINNTRTGYNSKSLVWEDLSGNNNDTNLINFNEIKWNVNSLTFDGIDDYLSNIEIKDTNEVTFQFMLKHDYTGKYMNIYEKYNMQQPMLLLDNSSKFEFCATYNLGDLFDDFSNKVTVITTAINSEKSNLYINMDKINYDFKGIANTNGIYNLFNRNGENTYKGNVYAIRIYNRVLTESEIQYNYQIDKKRFNLD